MATPVSDRTARYDETRERIIDIAAQLFAKNGYAATGVAELGEAVGLARGALYYYIKSKDALLSAIHDRVLDPLLESAAKIYALKISAPARLVLLSELLLRMIVDYRDHVWVFLHEYHHLQGEDRKRFRTKRAEFEEYVGKLIVEGNESGAFAVEDVRLATLAWLNMHNYTYQWLRGKKGFTVERLSQGYMRLLLKGFANTPFPFGGLRDEVELGRSILGDNC